MVQVQFGVQYNGVSMAAVVGPLEFARRMEALGYRSYFVPELETLPTLDPFILLAAVAQHTERMRLGTGVAVLPFRSPYQTAKIAASIDVLSGGRMVLGLGSGGVFNNDFLVESVRPEDRRSLTDEGLELVRRLLSEERVTHSGAHHRMEDMALEPRSVQQPHLPIWTGAMWNGRFARRMLERTARWADGFHPHGMTPQGYAEGKAAIEEMAAGLGRDPSQFEWSCNMYLCMGRTREDAMAEVREAMRGASATTRGSWTRTRCCWGRRRTASRAWKRSRRRASATSSSTRCAARRPCWTTMSGSRRRCWGGLREGTRVVRRGGGWYSGLGTGDGFWKPCYDDNSGFPPRSGCGSCGRFVGRWPFGRCRCRPAGHL